MTRPTRSDISRRLDELDGDEEYPTASLAWIIACEWDPVDTDRRLYRCLSDGQVYAFGWIDDAPIDLVVRPDDGALCVLEDPDECEDSDE